jgi:hypothetical protein
MISKFAAAFVFCSLAATALSAKAPQKSKIEYKLFRIKTDKAKVYTEPNKAAPVVLEVPAGYIFQESGLAADEKFDRSAWVYLVAGYIEKNAVEPGPGDVDRYDLGMASDTCAYNGKDKIICNAISKKKKKSVEFDVSGIKHFLNSTSTCNDPQRSYYIEHKLSEIDSNRKGPTMADYAFYVKKGTKTVVQLEQNHSPWECH